MATNRWVSKAVKRAQVDTLTVTAYDVGTTYKVTIGNKTISTVGTGGTTATTAAALAALLQASTDGEFQEIQWAYTSGNSFITGTANVTGKPFTLTFTVSGGTGTVSLAHTTTNSSPNDVNDGLNWSAGTIPANGEDVIIDFGDENQSLKWNLDALSAVTLNSLTRRRTFTGRAALDEINTDGTPYTEYRATEFTFGLQGAFKLLIEQPGSDGAAWWKINSGTTKALLRVQGDGPGSLYAEALWWRGTNVNNTVTAENASLAVAPVNSNAATWLTMDATNSSVRCGDTVTQATLTNNGSTIELNSALTTLVHSTAGGTTLCKGTGALGTATLDGGSLVYWSTGTITTLTLGVGTAFDCSGDPRARTITNKVNLYAGSVFNDPAGTCIAGGLSVQTVKCGIETVRINVGSNHSYAITA